MTDVPYFCAHLTFMEIGLMNTEYREMLHGEFRIFYNCSRPPGRLHIHSQLELVLVCCEGISCRLEDQTVPVPKGTLLTFRDTDLHGLYSQADGSFPRYIVYFSPAFVSGFSDPEINLLSCFYRHNLKTPNMFYLDEHRFKQCISYLTELNEFNRQADVFARRLRQQLILGQLLLIAAEEQHQIFPGMPGMADPDSAIVYQAMSYIRANITNPLSLAHLSRKFLISQTRLHDAFRRITGDSPGSYIIHCRIACAKDLLLRGSSVEQAALCAGYGNLSHFCRMFRRSTGMTPKQYQKKQLSMKMPSR